MLSQRQQPVHRIGQPGYETRAWPPSPPHPLAIQLEQPGARAEGVMQLEDARAVGGDQGHGVVCLVAARETSGSHRGGRRCPIAEHQHVDIGHRAVRRRVVQRLGDGGALERKGGHAGGLQPVKHVGGEIQATERRRQASAVAGPQLARDGRSGPGGVLALHGVVQQCAEALACGRSHQRLGRRRIQRRGQASVHEPAPQRFAPRPFARRRHGYQGNCAGSAGRVASSVATAFASASSASFDKSCSGGVEANTSGVQPLRS